MAEAGPPVLQKCCGEKSGGREMYRKADKGWLKHCDFTLIDAICLQAAYIAAYFIRQGSRWPYASQLYRNMAFVFLFIQIFVTFFGESFKNVLKRGKFKELTETIKHVCQVILIAAFYLFATQKGEEYSRITLVTTGILYVVISYIARIYWKKYLLTRGLEGKGKRSLLILTSKGMVEEVVQNILNKNYERFHIIGVSLMDADWAGKTINGVTIVTDQNGIAEYVCREWVDEVFINLPKDMPLPQELMDDFIDMGVTVHLKLIEMGRLKGQIQHVERLGSYTVLTSCINMASWRQAFIKRAMDIVGGILGCILTGIMFLFVAPCICVQSPGPIFFSQVRIGKNGKRFKLYKFRSMYMDAEERKKELMNQNRVKDGMMFKIENDPRIIGGKKGIGNFIRNYSIDEFPQFWNVLKGDMSLVGTRPPTVDEWEKYDLHHRVRLSVKPGITGMWQVSGRSEITDFEEVVKLDKEYITEWRMGLDIKILLQTVQVVLGRGGAM